MCWNAEVSLNTFIFGVISAIIVLLLDQNHLPMVILLLSITFMQLVEYFAWRNINNKEAIKLISLSGMCLILLQIIIINIIYLQGNERIIILILILLLSLVVLVYDINNNKLSMEKAVNGHLTWEWANVPIPILIMVFIFYLYGGLKKRDLSFIFVSILLIISLYSYYKYKTWGSMWCYFLNILWVFLIAKLLLNKIYLKKRN